MHVIYFKNLANSKKKKKKKRFEKFKAEEPKNIGTCEFNACPTVLLCSSADFACITYQQQTSQEQEEQSCLGEEICHSVGHEAQGSH